MIFRLARVVASVLVLAACSGADNGDAIANNIGSLLDSGTTGASVSE